MEILLVIYKKTHEQALFLELKTMQLLLRQFIKFHKGACNIQI